MEIHCEPRERRIRTLLVSDVHLGCRYAQPEHFLAYLEQVRPDRIYILGDFLDGWKLSVTWRWKPVYTRILNRLLTLAQGGTEIFYTPGNHDAFLRCSEVRQIVESSGVKVQMEDEFVYESSNGHRFLVTHGDRFDMVEMKYQWLSMATAFVYEPLLFCNWLLNKLSRQKAKSPYAICAVVKNKVKSAVKFLSSFEQKLYDHARSRGCDGIICGHIHLPGVERIDSVTYLNTGDWVENCTALVEHYDGTIYLESFFPSTSTQQVVLEKKMPTWKPNTRPRIDTLPDLPQPLPDVACVG